MKIRIVGVPVSDQEKALKFYTEILGFVKKHDIPVGGGHRWITVVSKDEPDGPEVSLEPSPRHFEPIKVFQEALFEKGIPWTQFNVDNIDEEHERLTNLGVEFKSPPAEMGGYKSAILNDTCGNYIILVQVM